MSFTTKMTEQFVQHLYQKNTGAKGQTKNNGVPGKAGRRDGWKPEADEAAVYEPGSRQAEKSATYQKPANVAKNDRDSDLKANLEKVYESLSKEAKEYLEQLKQKFDDIDFFVADCKSDGEMGRYFAMGRKAYSCVISPELLEKMATDEEVRAKYEGVIERAGESLEEVKAAVKEEFGEEAAEKITHIGFTVNDNGVVDYFVKLKNSNDTYYAKLKEKREEEKAEAKKAEKKKEEEAAADRVRQDGWIHADSVESLLEEIRKALGLEKKEETPDIAVGEAARE